MKTILYTTDYSKNSVGALYLARALANKLDALLIALHLFDTPISLASTGSLSQIKKEKKLFAKHRNDLKQFCSKYLGAIEKETNFKMAVDRAGFIADGILEKIVKFDADMVVLGTTAAGPIRKLLLGSTAKTVIRKAPCNVLVVPANCRDANFKTVVYATDFEQADIFAIKKLAKMAAPFAALIRVIHITTKNEYKGDQQMEWFKEMLLQKVSYDSMEFNLIYADEIFEELHAFLKSENADLLAMLEREDKGLFRKLFHKDLVVKMESNISIPLLSFNVAGL